MVNFFAVCGCCTRTDIVREHLEDTLRICDVSAKGLYYYAAQSSPLLALKITLTSVFQPEHGSEMTSFLY